MDPAKEMPSEAPLLDAIGDISEHGYVLVRGTNREIKGIVTGSDIAHQFLHLASPFLLIEKLRAIFAVLCKESYYRSIKRIII